MISGASCYLQYRTLRIYNLFENILHGFWLEIISETITVTRDNRLEEKRIIFSFFSAKSRVNLWVSIANHY